MAKRNVNDELLAQFQSEANGTDVSSAPADLTPAPDAPSVDTAVPPSDVQTTDATPDVTSDATDNVAVEQAQGAQSDTSEGELATTPHEDFSVDHVPDLGHDAVPYDQENPPADGYSDVDPTTLIEAAKQYPLQAFSFAADHLPQALPAVLAVVNEENPAVAYDLLLGFVNQRIEQVVAEATAPLNERNLRLDSHANAAEALNNVHGRIADANDLGTMAAQVAAERESQFNGHTRADIENFLQDCYDIARGRLASEGGLTAASDPEHVVPEPPVVAAGTAESSPADDTQGEDPWHAMEGFRAALGV